MVELKKGEWYHTNDSDPWFIKFDKITKSEGYVKIWFTEVIRIEESKKIIKKRDFISGETFQKILRLPTKKERIEYNLTKLENIYELW